jgi:hypothetical protein
MPHASKTKGTQRFNLPSGLYLADNYMRMADRATKDIERNDSGDSGPICLAISSFAFALEIYFKSIVFAGEEKALKGHDLMCLWDSLPDAVRGWLSENFDRNYRSTGKDWSALFLFSIGLRGTSDVSTLAIPGASARDMVYGHRLAFTVGRYGYELPPASQLKPILYNISGLQLLAWLSRVLAYHFFEELRALSARDDQGGQPQRATIRLPGGSIPRFPND